MLELFVATEIHGSAQEVWRVLTDLGRYHEWNPFIRRASGALRPGDQVRVRVRTSVGIEIPFRATVLVHREGHELRWRGHFLSRRLACGEHSFELETLGEHHVRFVQRESFAGLLPWLARRLLERETRSGFGRMNGALKSRVEGVAAAAA